MKQGSCITKATLIEIGICRLEVREVGCKPSQALQRLMKREEATLKTMNTCHY